MPHARELASQAWRASRARWHWSQAQPRVRSRRLQAAMALFHAARCRRRHYPTGPAAAGIGLACAQSLGHAGAKVLVCDIDGEGIRKAEQQLKEEGIEAASTVCDVSSKQQVGSGGFLRGKMPCTIQSTWC